MTDFASMRRNSPRCGAAGTLGDVLRGEMRARRAGEVSVYAPVGLPWQDLALTWWLYQRAKDSGAVVIDLLS